jgi:hypothetical protein
VEAINALCGRIASTVGFLHEEGVTLPAPVAAIAQCLAETGCSGVMAPPRRQNFRRQSPDFTTAVRAAEKPALFAMAKWKTYTATKWCGLLRKCTTASTKLGFATLMAATWFAEVSAIDELN